MASPPIGLSRRSPTGWRAMQSCSASEKPTNEKMSGYFLLLFNSLCYHIRRCLKQHIGLWLSLVERCVRDAEAAGSNPVNPTRKNKASNSLAFFVVLVARRPLERHARQCAGHALRSQLGLTPSKRPLEDRTASFSWNTVIKSREVFDILP